MINIFFTGLSGFLGQNFLKYFNSQNCHNFRLIPNPNNYRSKDENYSYAFKKNDFMDNIDILVHAGAYSPKTRNDMNNMNNINNITNTKYLLENLPNIPQKIIFISSISVYKLNQQIISEDSSLEGDSIYGTSKLMCEKLIEEFCKVNNVEYQILRVGVIYGNNPTVQGLIPTFIKNIIQNKHIKIFNSGIQKRNFINVFDVSRIIFESLDLPVKYPIINVIGDSCISVREIADFLIQNSNKNIEIENIVNNEPIVDIIFDGSKMIEIFGKNQVRYFDGLACAYNDINKENSK